MIPFVAAIQCQWLVSVLVCRVALSLGAAVFCAIDLEISGFYTPSLGCLKIRLQCHGQDFHEHILLLFYIFVIFWTEHEAIKMVPASR
jgi:hypothetical protein